jgi:archaellum component FlaF (FlaF/FlaG flagellin family)
MKACPVFALIALVVSISVVLIATPSGASTGTTELVSVDNAGGQGDGHSQSPVAISADGRYVAFQSDASNLVPGDTNYITDVFVHDRHTGTTERVSVNSAGGQGNNQSQGPAISADGRYVAFISTASNLVSSDTNPWNDVFIHDRQTGITERVSVDINGDDANLDSYDPSLSADGQYVAFFSYASDLVPSDTNPGSDIFVRDRQTGQTQLASVAGDGSQANDLSTGPDISADGRYVSFHSKASNLLADDTNGVEDIFVHDRQTGDTELASVDSNGNQANADSQRPSISGDGRYVVFNSGASNLVPGDPGWADIFVHDREARTTERISVATSGTPANFHSEFSAISGNGRFVAFDSEASNLVSDDSNTCAGLTSTVPGSCRDVFLHDLDTGITERVSFGFGSDEGNGYSWRPAVSSNGILIAFASAATNLVPNDTNGSVDVYAVDNPLAPSPTPTPTPPAPVGGTIDLQRDAPVASAGAADSPAFPYTALAIVAAAAFAVAAGAWYLRGRRSS